MVFNSREEEIEYLKEIIARLDQLSMACEAHRAELEDIRKEFNLEELK